MNTIAPKDRIIFALDVPSITEAERFAALLKDHVGVFKIGLELFVSSGPAVVEAVREASNGKAGIFLDMKFHDIPETVRGAMRSASGINADFITVHCDEGKGLLKAVVEGSAASTRVLGVTVLTSISKADLADIGIDEKYSEPVDLVLHRAGLAKAAGCAGVVCSGKEARAVRHQFGPEFLIITPGIRGTNDPVGDQKRVTTPYEAVQNGADYIVVGRPIKNAADPVKAADAIAAEVARALKEK